MKLFLALIAVATFSGCATTPPLDISELSNFDACNRAVRGSRSYSEAQLMAELARRGENCQSHMPMIQAKIQAEKSNNNAQAALGMQLLQMGQPKPFAPMLNNSTQCQTRFRNGIAYTDCN